MPIYLPVVAAGAYVIATAATVGFATANANADADDARYDADISAWCY